MSHAQGVSGKAGYSVVFMAFVDPRPYLSPLRLKLAESLAESAFPRD